jgi:RNA polymerase subunit RPABC4/transcription elongation factor Spt4
MSITEFPDGNKKVCKTCGALMPSEALKCTKCDTIYGWRGYLSVSTTTLALITALISVSATAITPLLNALKSHDSKLTISLQGDDNNHALLLLAINSGDRPGGIGTVDIYIPFKNEKPNQPKPIYSGYIDDKSPSFVNPGYGVQVRVRFNIDTSVKTRSIYDVSGNCVITVTTVEFSGRQQSFRFERNCGDLYTVIGLNERG